MKRISVIGCGWYGTPMALALMDSGYEVLGTTRNENRKKILEQKGVKTYPLAAPETPEAELLESDIIILNIPPTAGGYDWFSRWPWCKDSWLIFISSTSGNLKAEEEWIMKNFQHWTILRFGGLLGKDRHPGKTLAGRKGLQGKNWPVNLLHLDDAIGFTLSVIEQGIKTELINVVSSEHSTRKDFYQDYCRGHQLPLPEFDEEDRTTRPAVDHTRAQEIYEFKWPIMIGKSL